MSLSLISLTVTVYMIVQGIAPSFWGPMSDTKGRRITFIGTVLCSMVFENTIAYRYEGTFVVYLIANVGLAFSNNFTALMVFRGIQAAGSAATISVGKTSYSLPQELRLTKVLGAGVIGDITTARERGGLIGIFGGSKSQIKSM